MTALRALVGLFALVLACGFAPADAPTKSPFRDWAAVVVAADWRATNGKPTAAFENARRDVSALLLGSGFRSENLRTFAVDPGGRAGVGETTPRNVFTAVQQTSRDARAGCLLYFTSHGSPKGIVFGRKALLPPGVLARLVDATCAKRPTVVMISACFSGVYVPALAAPNRLILTAARPDRTSFGCGEDDVYPFFDACVLESWPKAADFLALGQSIRSCVARRETELKLSPPSEPQISAGAAIRPLLPLLPLPGARPAG